MKCMSFLRLSTLVLAMGVAVASPAHAASYQIETIMTNLVTPRGLAFAPDGALYVAEAGSGGDPLFSPSLISNGASAFMGYTGAISKWTGGMQTRVLTGLPSLAGAGGAEASGLNDIVFDAGGQAYGLFGLGATPAQRDSLGGLNAWMFGTVTKLSLDGTGKAAPIADISRYEGSNNPDGGVIDTNPYGMARQGDNFIIADAGGNSFVQATSAGVVTLLDVLPARPNPLPFGPPVYQSVPTSVAIGPDGNYYVGELTGFPFLAGAANVYRYDPATQLTTIAYSGFSTIVDLNFDASGNLYVLQISSNGLAAADPGPGQLLKIDGQTGVLSVIASDGLDSPGGLAIQETLNGPVFYVTTHTSGPSGGSVLRVSPVPEPASWALLLAGMALVGGIAKRQRA